MIILSGIQYFLFFCNPSSHSGSILILYVYELLQVRQEKTEDIRQLRSWLLDLENVGSGHKKMF
jgi:hypothetical protein